MPSRDFGSVYAALRPLLTRYEDRLNVDSDTETGYMLRSKVPSPLKQHKGVPLFFAGIRVGKAYVSYHLFPLYMNPKLNAKISPELKKRMQGKSCFNFTTVPESSVLAELGSLTEEGYDQFRKQMLV